MKLKVSSLLLASGCVAGQQVGPIAMSCIRTSQKRQREACSPQSAPTPGMRFARASQPLEVLDSGLSGSKKLCLPSKRRLF